MIKTCTYGQRGKSVEQRFSEKYIVADGCWEWTSAKQAGRYGVLWFGGGKSVFAHRFAWELANKRKVPDGMVVMHLCNNKGCVNPAHLDIGSPADNVRAAVKDGLNAFGERNGGGRKLTSAQAVAIYKDARSSRVVAREYGVSRTTVKSIRRGNIWRCATQAALKVTHVTT